MRQWRPQHHQNDAVASIDSIRDPAGNSAAFVRSSLSVIHAIYAEYSAAHVGACVCVHIFPSSTRSDFGLVQAGAAGSVAPGPV